MKLSNRLETIANLVPYDSVVADIGTDHGYIPVYLITKGIVKTVIGSDISHGSLSKIKTYVKENKLEDKIDLRLGDGLGVLKASEVDTVIIAGMGGLLIQDILEKNKEITDSIRNFILQPMVASVELRKYLMENDFVIMDEELSKEGNKYYEIIFARKGIDSFQNKWDLVINPILVEKNHKFLKGFILSRIHILEKIISQLDNSRNCKSKYKHKETNKYIDFYREVLKKIES